MLVAASSTMAMSGRNVWCMPPRSAKRFLRRVVYASSAAASSASAAR